VEAALACLYDECTSDPACFQPTTIDGFFIVIATNPDLASSLFCRVRDYAVAAPDTIAFRVGLTALSFIASSGTDVIEDYRDDLSSLFEAAVSCGDPAIHAELCNLITIFADNAPVCLESYYNTVIALLIERFRHPDSLRALETLLLHVDQAPDDPRGTFAALAEILNEENADSVVNCIAGAISHLPHADEDLYILVRDLLTNLMSNDIAMPEVFACFGLCGSLAPRLLIENLPDVVSAMVSALDANSLGHVAAAFGSLIARFPITLAPFAPQFYNFFSARLSPPQDTDEPDDDTPSNTATGETMRACTRIVAAYPESLSGRFQSLIEVISDWLNSPLVVCNSFAAESLEDLSPVLYRLGFSPGGVISALLSHIQNSNPPPAEYLNVLGNILLDNGLHIDPAQVNAFYIEALRGHIASVADRGQISPEFEPPLYYSIQGFVLGGAFGLVDGTELVSLLVHQSQNRRNRGVQCLAVMVLARICFISQNAEIAQSIIAISLENLSHANRCTQSMTNSYFASFMYLLISHRDLFSMEQLVAIKAGCETGMGSLCVRETALVLWLVVVAICELPAEIDQIAEVLAGLPPRVEDEGMMHFSMALTLVMEKMPEIVSGRIERMAAAIVAAPVVHTQRIPTEQFAVWCDLLRPLAPETILELLDFNEAHLQAVQSILGLEQ
jgi:hypothetical protein